MYIAISILLSVYLYFNSAHPEFSSAMSSPFPPLLTSVLFSVFLQAQTWQTVCITCLLSQWMFEQLHCYSIRLSVIFLLISMCMAPGAWVIAFGLQETWNKRAAPAPNTLLFEYKIINFWKQIRRGWRKVQKRALLCFSYCWDSWAVGRSVGDVMQTYMEANLFCSKCYSFLMKKKQNTTAAKTHRHVAPRYLDLFFPLFFHFTSTSGTE